MVFLKKQDNPAFVKTAQDLKKDIEQLKEEFNEHLDAINENTNEIQANYTYASELDKRIGKLNDKVDEISMMLKHFMAKSNFIDEKKPFVQQLSQAEKKIFLVLYTSENLLSYKDLAVSSDITEPLVSQYITSLIEKGVPLVKQYVGGKPLIGLTANFKELQAKSNLINLG